MYMYFCYVHCTLYIVVRVHGDSCNEVPWPLPSALLFSATFRKKVERLCRDVLTDPVRIVVGGVGEANVDITQVAEVMENDQDKWVWLLKHLVEFTSSESSMY